MVKKLLPPTLKTKLPPPTLKTKPEEVEAARSWTPEERHRIAGIIAGISARSNKGQVGARAAAEKEKPIETPEEKEIKKALRKAESDLRHAEYQELLAESKKQQKRVREAIRDRGYKKVPIDFLRHCKLSDAEIKTFFGFLAFTNKDLETFVGVERVANATKQSHSRLYKPIYLLIKKGYLKVTKREIIDGKTIVLRRAIFIPKGKWKKEEFQSKAVVRIPFVFLKHHIKNMTSREFHVFMALLTFSDVIQYVKISNAAIQSHIGGSIYGIDRAIRNLKNKGYVQNRGNEGRTKLRKLVFLPEIGSSPYRISYECPYSKQGSKFGASYNMWEQCKPCDLYDKCWAENQLILNAESESLAAKRKEDRAAKQLAGAAPPV